MTTTMGYNQCNSGNVVLDSYQTDVNYLNVDLSLVKSEPIDYLQSNNNSNQIYYVQNQQQQICSPRLPPTPPSPSTDHQLAQIDIKNIQLINQQQTNLAVNNLPISNTATTIKSQSQITKYSYRKNKNQLHNNQSKPYSLPSINDHQIIKSKSISKRNERERKRVRNVNLGFQKLRQRIPNTEKKMSKVETLRSAVKYIRELQESLNQNGSDSSSTEFLFNILHQNHASLSSMINDSELSNSTQATSNQLHNQDQNSSSSSLDCFDLAFELLSQ